MGVVGALEQVALAEEEVEGGEVDLFNQLVGQTLLPPPPTVPGHIECAEDGDDHGDDGDQQGE